VSIIDEVEVIDVGKKQSSFVRRFDDAVGDDNDDDDSGKGVAGMSVTDDDCNHTCRSTYVADLGVLPLAVLIFYNVSGGPFGIEPTVRAGGPFFAIMGFLLAPLLWSVPEALVTAELGSAYPEASGGVAWVEEAFGTNAGLFMGYLGWVSGATDNAIYPVLFLEYMVTLFVSDDDRGGGDGWEDMGMTRRFLFLVGVSGVLTVINYLGLEIVGNVSIAIALVSMSPFIIMTIMALPQLDPRRWMVMPIHDVASGVGTDGDDDFVLTTKGWFPVMSFAGVMWRPFLNNLFWNLNSFDAAASFSGEVRDVGSTYPRAIFVACILVILGYLVPLLAGLGGTDSQQDDWVDGYFTTICTQIGGKWLGAWTVLAAGVSNLALFEAEMSTDSFQVYGMAKRGLLPKLFSRRSRFHTPTYGILLGFAVIVLMSMADFSALVEMLNFNYSIALLMEYVAFIKLRITQPEVERPFKIKMGTLGCILLVLPPFLLTLLLMLMASYLTYVYCIGFIILGFMWNYLQQIAKDNNWCEFHESKKNKTWREVIYAEMNHEGRLIHIPINSDTESGSDRNNEESSGSECSSYVSDDGLNT